jgi:trehalose 6-phosphate synthase
MSRLDANRDRAWTAERLRQWMTRHHGGESIVVLANREPFRHDRAPDGGIVATRCSGGLVTALEPLVCSCAGVWVAHGAGTADKDTVDEQDAIDVSGGDGAYRLRRVWLNNSEERGYYYGFANEGLWPLCHTTHVNPTWRTSDYRTYRSVNARFAAVVGDESASETPVVLVQDYHFALAPQMIRERRPMSTIITFWHVPWPEVARFRDCPWRRQLLEGLLGSSIVGFQTPEDCRHFLDAVADCLEAHVDRRRQIIRYGGRQTRVRAYPVSVEWPSRLALQSPPVETCRAEILRELALPPDVTLCVGIDRLDYTKGLTEKCLAVEQLLESSPEVVGRFVLVQVAEPSRHCLPAYRQCRERLLATIDRINRRFPSAHGGPIQLRIARHEPAAVYRLLRAADICYVGSLHDGMNLVAKEFVSARDDEQGVLILSRFAGASKELRAALVVDPFATAAAAAALGLALRMSRGEQALRMRALRIAVSEFNTYRWAANMLADGAACAAASREVPTMSGSVAGGLTAAITAAV